MCMKNDLRFEPVIGVTKFLIEIRFNDEEDDKAKRLDVGKCCVEKLPYL